MLFDFLNEKKLTTQRTIETNIWGSLIFYIKKRTNFDNFFVFVKCDKAFQQSMYKYLFHGNTKHHFLIGNVIVLVYRQIYLLLLC